MPASLTLRLALALGVTLMITASCGGTTTEVGSILGDGGALDGPGSTAPDGGPAGGDASADALGDASLDAHPDGSSGCAAGACGTNVCGRDECGHTCGTCAGAPAQGGCFMGKCNPSCPGTPCLDHNGEHVCEGGRGGHACAGGALGIQVCTCTGAGADAWSSCGPCL